MKLKDTICNFFVTGFYSGKISKKAPGTIGTVVALILFYILANFLKNSDFLLFSQILIIIVTFFFGVYCINSLIKNSFYKVNSDPQEVVIDEFLGLAITLIGVEASILNYFLGFVLFRVFDISKLFPANRLENLPDGWGVMMDDLMAGIYASICLHIILAYI